MNRVKKFSRVLVMMVVICSMLIPVVHATGDGSVWIRNTESSIEEVTNTWIVTDKAVTDGLVELTYNADVLTYQGVEANEANVAMYAVNADEAGIVKISWVAPGAETPDENQWLFKLTFAGKGNVAMTGSVNGGEAGAFAVLDTSELEKTILEAEGLYQDDYTTRSWNTMVKALDAARAVLDDPTADQLAVNAAAETLNNGMASLEVKLITNNAELYKAIRKAQGLNGDDYTAESWAELEKALTEAKQVQKNRKATQKQIDDATDALNEAIDNLELKPAEPTQPTEPEKPEGSSGSLIDIIRKLLGKWFGGWGN